jgi:hypothetical protein
LQELFLIILLLYGKVAPMPPKTQKLLDDLKEWCDQSYGRRSEVAKVVGLGPQAITDWFGGRRQPTAEQILVVQEFLAKQKSRRKSTG